MAGKKDFKALEKRLLRLGFTYVHTNASSCFVYSHPQHPDLVVNPGLNDNSAKVLLRKVEKALGELAKAPKRNATAIKERQAAERERQAEELARLDAERAEILRRKDAQLSGAGASLTPAEIRAIEERVVQIDHERRAIERLMHAPVTGAHDPSRAVRHRS